MTAPASHTPALVVSADDLGLAHAYNRGIQEAATHGVLTSACIRVNGMAFEAALDEVVAACPDLGVGVHLNIVEGSTTRERVRRASHLYHADGRYRATFWELLYRQHDAALRAEIEADYRDQIERALRVLPQADHLNSHQHSHAVPAIYELVCRLAAEYKIPFVRWPWERFYFAPPAAGHLRPWYALNLCKVGVLSALARRTARVAPGYGVRTNDSMIGIAYTGFMGSSSVVRGLAAARSGAPRIVELLLHPCRPVAGREERYSDDAVREYTCSPARVRELETLLDPALASGLRQRWHLASFRELAGPGSAAATPPARSSATV